jgi:acyl dehydratase
MSIARPVPAPDASALGFEDLRPGQRFSGGDRLVTAEDLATFTAVSGDRHPLHTDAAYATQQGFAGPLLQGPFGIAAFFGWFFELGLARDSIVALLDTDWHYRAPLRVGDRIGFEMTITRVRRTSSGERGVVGRHVRIRNQEGEIVQEGSTSVLLRAAGTRRRVGHELMTRPWAEALAQRLNACEPFRAATATWDGTIGLACGDEEMQFRIYRGRVLEAGARVPNGATFAVAASELTWAQMMSAERADFMTQAMQGAFSVRGNAYEYLRLAKALGLLVDCARALFQAEGRP